MSVKEKSVHFLTALADVYRDGERRELVAFPKMIMPDNFSDDLTAMLLGMFLLIRELAEYDGDLLEFTHTLNELAVRYIIAAKNNNMEGTKNE